MQLDDDWSIAMAVMATSQSLHNGRQPTYVEVAALKQHPLLTSPASKLRWAQGNLAGLAQNIVDAFSSPSDLAVLDADRDSETGEYVYRIAAQPPLDDFGENFSHAVADLAKNIRSIYDKLAWCCAKNVRAAARRDERLANFPIQESESAFDGMTDRAAMFAPEHWAFFKKFQPYLGLNGWSDSWIGDYVHPIGLVGRLANDDEHADTWPVLMTANQFNLRRFDYETVAIPDAPDGATQIAFTWTGLNQPMEVGLEVMRVRIHGLSEPHIDNAARVSPLVCLPEGRGAVATMERLYRHAHLILSEFALEFPAT